MTIIGHKPKPLILPASLRAVNGDRLASYAKTAAARPRVVDLRVSAVVHGFYAIIPPEMPWHRDDLPKSSLAQ